MTKAAIKP